MNFRLAVLLGVGLVLDQLTKFFAERTLSFFTPVHIIPQFLSFQLVHNYGAAYGLFQYQRLALVCIAFVIILGVFYYLFFHAPSLILKVGLVFLLIGAIGNLIDRICLGYVIDFVDIGIFPVFNLADVSIDLGLLCVVWDAFKPQRKLLL